MSKWVIDIHGELEGDYDLIKKYEEQTIDAIPKADYENRLKADLKAILVELQLEIEEKFNDRPFSYNHHQRTEFYRDIDEVIQQKINALKADTEDQDGQTSN